MMIWAGSFQLSSTSVTISFLKNIFSSIISSISVIRAWLSCVSLMATLLLRLLEKNWYFHPLFSSVYSCDCNNELIPSRVQASSCWLLSWWLLESILHLKMIKYLDSCWVISALRMIDRNLADKSLRLRMHWKLSWKCMFSSGCCLSF